MKHNQEFFWPAYSLCKREVVRFFRQRSRVIGAIVPPLVFWFLIGSGLGNSFRGSNYLIYLFPGTLVMIVLFTAIFSTISIIEDRREGFLQSVLVAPIAPASVALGKILGGAMIAFLQSMIFVIIAPMLGASFTFLGFVFLLAILFLSAFGLTGLGFLIAWKMDSTQGFHSVMNLFLMPMWFLSGSLFPVEGAPMWLKCVMLFNPLTYSVTAVRMGLFSGNFIVLRSWPGPLFCLAVSLLFCAVTFSAAVLSCSKKTIGENIL